MRLVPGSVRRRILIVGLLAVMLATTAALATTAITLRKTKTFTLRSGKTKTFKVAYPDGLTYARSKYSGKVTILAPAPGVRGVKPSLKKVHVLSKSTGCALGATGCSCPGGGYFCATVKNANKGTAPIRVRITATTRLPPGKKP
jgi:hypothetical protein